MSTIVITEGDTDRALVEALQTNLKVPKPKKRAPGREAAIERAADAATMVGDRQIVLMLDWNSHTEKQLVDEVTGVLKRSWNHSDLERVDGAWRHADGGFVRLVMAGTPSDPRLIGWGIDRSMADDYLLALCLRDDSLGSFCDGERHLTWRPDNAAGLEALLVRTAEVFKEHDITLSSSKRYVHLVKAAIGFEASRATFAKHLIKRAADVAKTEVLGELQRKLVSA